MDNLEKHDTLIEGITPVGLLSAVGAVILVVSLYKVVTVSVVEVKTYATYGFIGLTCQWAVAIFKPHLIWRLVGVCVFSLISAMLLALIISSMGMFFKI
jgi:hypothetical protein